LPLLVIVMSLGGCQKKPQLSDFCGQVAVNAFYSPAGNPYLSFPDKHEAGLIDIEVSTSEYRVYGDGKRPIDCALTEAEVSVKAQKDAQALVETAKDAETASKQRNLQDSIQKPKDSKKVVQKPTKDVERENLQKLVYKELNKGK
jgi:hypothetical protein